MTEATSSCWVEGCDRLGASLRVEALVCEGALAIFESRSPGLLRMLIGRWQEGEEWTVRLEARGKLTKSRISQAPASAVEALLMKSREIQRVDPRRGMRFAHAALQAAQGPKAGYRATGWILLGNAARLRGWQKTSAEAFGNALRCVGGPVDEGLYCRALGLLRRDQGLELEAVALLDYAARCFRARGFDGEAACCLGLRCLLEMESYREVQGLSIASFRALAGIDPDLQPGLYTTLRATLACMLAIGGFRQEAQDLLEGWRIPPLEDLESAQVQYQLGQARRALEDFEGANRCFERASSGFLKCGRRYEMTLASWELAVECARREAWGELESVAQQFSKTWPIYGEVIEQAFRELRWVEERTARPTSCDLWLKLVLESSNLRRGPFVYA